MDTIEALPEDRRKEIFAALVESQDQGERVIRSQVDVAERFGITRQIVKTIEREGLDHKWPPL